MSTWSLTSDLSGHRLCVTSATGVLVRLWVLTPQLASQVGAPTSAWPDSRSLLAYAQSSLSSGQGSA